MSNYINLAELRKTAEALLVKINDIKEDFLTEDNIDLKSFSSGMSQSDINEKGNLVLGTINDQSIIFPGDAFEQIVQSFSSMLSEKINEPYQEGTNGQVLTTDGNGGRSWATISSGTVSDVQIDGTSILNNGIANIPYASDSTPGVIKVNYHYGIGLYPPNNTTLAISGATDSQIKTGTESRKPITPLTQHSSVFYGLAKAAGDATQASSSNAVGTYTDNAKTAIQSMLGLDTKTEIFLVTLTGEVDQETEEATITSDKTVAEILQAKSAGKVIYATLEDVLFFNTTIMDMSPGVGMVVFTATFDNSCTIFIGENYTGQTDNWKMTGSWHIQDIQVAGSSVISDGVANIPVMDNNNYGVARLASRAGVKMDEGALNIRPAGEAIIKAGTSSNYPLAPNKQEVATFYGLAKAAGDTTQAESSNAVGTYTDSAKAAIQAMLGINNMLAPIESDTTADQAYSIGNLFTYNGKLYKATTTIASGATIIPNTNCTETTLAEEIITRCSILPAAGVSF